MKAFRKVRSVVSILGVVLVACDGAEEPTDERELSTRQSAIIGGRQELGFQAVGQVRDATGACSGALISPTLVLTARHCPTPNVSFNTGFFISSMTNRPVTRVLPHPYTRDLMLLQLRDAVTGIATLPINTGALPAPGTTCTIVGYGNVDAAGTDATTRKSARVQVVSTDTIRTLVSRIDGIGAGGDSGGPLVCNGSIVGVYHGPDAAGRGIYANVDPAWIQNPYLPAPVQVAPITVAANLDRRLETMLIKPNTFTVYESFEAAANGEWVPLFNYSWNKQALALALAANGDGRLETFYLGTDEVPYRYFQTSPNASWNWGAPAAFSLGGAKARALTVGTNPNGGLVAFYAQKSDGQVFVTMQENFDSLLYHVPKRPIEGEPSWGPASAIAGVRAKALVAAQNKISRLQLFFIDLNDEIYVSSGAEWSSGSWTAPKLLTAGARGKALAVGTNANGELEVFWVGMDDLVYRSRQDGSVIVGSGLNMEQPFGPAQLLSSVPTRTLNVSHNADGRLELFYIGLDGRLTHQWQTSPNGIGGFSGRPPLVSAPFVNALTVGMNGDGRLEVLYLAPDGSTSTTRQLAPNGAWSAPALIPPG